MERVRTADQWAPPVLNGGAVAGREGAAGGDPDQVALLRFTEEALRLIEDGASLEALGAARDELRRSPVSDSALATADEVYDRALRLREVLSGHRRRELELRGLIDTAADLSALRNVDAVLSAICRRVRSLLGTDAAWITLVDAERGDTYHCMTDGIVTDEPVREFRLSAGTGLGGLVLQTGTAEWTDDYLTDSRFEHTGPIDRSARDEGFAAMLGAPMRHGDTLLGIVITGNRGQRRFVTQDVTLLQTLADHAAIAIANANLLADAVRTSAELREANEQIHVNAESVARSASLHTRLSELILEGAELPELVLPVVDLLEGRVVVVDSEHRILAVAGQPLDDLDLAVSQEGSVLADDMLPPEIFDALAGVQDSGQSIAVSGDGARHPRLIAPMLSRSEPLGAVILTKHAVEAADQRLLESAALPLALFLANAHAQARMERVVRGELLADLISETAQDADSLIRRARQVGWDPQLPYVTVIVDSGEQAGRWLRLRANRLAAESGGLVTEQDGLVVLVLPGTVDTVSTHVTRALRGPGVSSPTVAVARSAVGVEGVTGAHREARQALSLALALGRSGTTVRADQTDAYGLVFGTTRPSELAEFVSRSLGPLVAYDEERGSDLIATLEAWFANDGHMVNTAKSAYIHVNTLYKRMERVESLLGDGWRDPDVRLQLQLALRLRRLSQELAPDVAGADGSARRRTPGSAPD